MLPSQQQQQQQQQEDENEETAAAAAANTTTNTTMNSNSNSAQRENSIEITAEDTLNLLRNLEFETDNPRAHTATATSSSNRGSTTKGSTSTKASNNAKGSSTSSRASMTAHERHLEKMGQSLNFLNLDNHHRQQRPTKTVGGGNPRVALMQLRIQRLKKTSPTDRLYQSDSALFGAGDQGHHRINKANARDAVWFKSSYPSRHTLEKLDEAEQELEESTHRSNSNSNSDNLLYDDMPELDDFNNTSCTDLWLHGNQSAPEDFSRRPTNTNSNTSSMDDDDDDDEHCEEDEESTTNDSETGGNREMADKSIRIV